MRQPQHGIASQRHGDGARMQRAIRVHQQGPGILGEPDHLDRKPWPHDRAGLQQHRNAADRSIGIGGRDKGAQPTRDVNKLWRGANDTLGAPNVSQRHWPPCQDWRRRQILCPGFGVDHEAEDGRRLSQRLGQHSVAIAEEPVGAGQQYVQADGDRFGRSYRVDQLRQPRSRPGPRSKLRKCGSVDIDDHHPRPRQWAAGVTTAAAGRMCAPARRPEPLEPSSRLSARPAATPVRPCPGRKTLAATASGAAAPVSTWTTRLGALI